MRAPEDIDLTDDLGLEPIRAVRRSSALARPSIQEATNNTNKRRQARDPNKRLQTIIANNKCSKTKCGEIAKVDFYHY